MKDVTQGADNTYASMWKQAEDKNKPTDNSTSVCYVLPSGLLMKTELLIWKYTVLVKIFIYNLYNQMFPLLQISSLHNFHNSYLLWYMPEFQDDDL